MPRAGLSPAAVVGLAMEVLDDVGWEGLTLAAVAQRAGVAVPSLYKHVAGLPALRREVRLVALRDLAAALTAALEAALEAALDEAARAAGGGSRTERVRTLARALRAYGLAHPGRYAASQVGVVAADDPELAAAGARVVGLLADVLGTTADTAVDTVRALRALVHGFVELETHGGFGLPDDVTASFERAVDLLLAGLGLDS